MMPLGVYKRNTVILMKPILSYTDLIDLIYHINIPKEHRDYTDAYILWNYGKYLLPGSCDREYMIDTHQEYIIRSWKHKISFQKLMNDYPGLRELYEISEKDFDRIK